MRALPFPGHLMGTECTTNKQISFLLLMGLCFLSTFTKGTAREAYAVHVFYNIKPVWGTAVDGFLPCGDTSCTWTTSSNIVDLAHSLHHLYQQRRQRTSFVTVSVINLHSVRSAPSFCDLPVNLSLATSEESRTRYWKRLFMKEFPHYDGDASPHPNATIQRIYREAYLNESTFIPLKPFKQLIKGGSFVVHNCQQSPKGSHRIRYAEILRSAGIHIDGLGRCLLTEDVPSHVKLKWSNDISQRLHYKRHGIGHYMFNMAFENTIEPGYVTEKAFDALMAGTVPVYLGDAAHLKSLLPHPKAAIFVSDFPDIPSLAKYLTYLTTNETAYEEHRAWRKHFSGQRHVLERSVLSERWECKICKWAAAKVQENRIAYEKRTEERLRACTSS